MGQNNPIFKLWFLYCLLGYGVRRVLSFFFVLMGAGLHTITEEWMNFQRAFS